MYRVLVRKWEGKRHWEDLGVDGWIILGRISSKQPSVAAYNNPQRPSARVPSCGEH